MNKLIKTQVSEVRCIQASRCKNTGKEIYTLELEYPRVVHSQLLTHSVFSKNSSSTRAVPIKAAIEQVRNNPAKYMWTENQAGMQGSMITDEDKLNELNEGFAYARECTIGWVESLASKGAHKQNAGRLLEPFQNIKIVLTATEWENWGWLRLDPDAQGEIADLAKAMKEARDTAEVMDIGPDEWHVPFVGRERDSKGVLQYFIEDDGELLTVEEAKDVSVSVCAQTSYRKSDHSLEKAKRIQDMLVDGRKVHASPFEHIATPITETSLEPNDCVDDRRYARSWQKGITHMKRDGTFCSGNFSGWVQLRQLVKGHDKALYE